ncbi:MAG: class I SAM-dependent methyltransferase [Thiogranum sp.]|jgi:2-polyprenyl-3-methyl-5-hydroxy-6-metoxy-1,4-benzoquinol methylase|nr:class I SAM-dependent methyltransferase [Thiogranum sp.]
MSEYFDNKARDWDADDMVRKLSSAIGSAILEHVPLHSQMSVMDFGAGTGLIGSYVAPRVNKIVAVDTSEAMLNRLVSKPELRGKVEAVCRDITDKPLDAQFDLIISAMAMHHVEDTHKLIQRFAEHLKPGAMLALADLDKEDGSFHPDEAAGVFHHGFERGELQVILEKHGFENVRFQTAHTVNREDKEFPVFLLIATKGHALPNAGSMS